MTIVTGGEGCPFDQFTLANAKTHVHVARAWVKKAPTFDTGDIRQSLTCLDKVEHPEEHAAATWELCYGKIYKCENQHSIVTHTKSLGLRRVLLHDATVRIAARFKPTEPQESAPDHAAIEASSGVEYAEHRTGKNNKALDELLKCAQAYSAISLPGVLRAWICGELNGRTLRPNAVARHHFEAIEHPNFPAGRRTHGPFALRTDKAVRAAIAKACKRAGYVGSNETVLKELRKSLVLVQAQPLDSLEAGILLKLSIYLCDEVGAASTILRYYDAILIFVGRIAKLVDSVEELELLDWHFLAKTLFDDKSDDEEVNRSRQAAFNHLLECIGVDFRSYRSEDPAAAARIYCDYPSAAEIARAIELAPTLNRLPDPRKDQPSTCLEVGSQEAIRHQEMADLRVVDVNFEGTPHCTITSESGGSLKSNNAPRVLTLERGRSGTAGLQALQNLRREQFPDKPKAYLFGDATESRTNKSADEILNVASDALSLVTGSNHISFRTLRQSVLSKKVRALLSPRASEFLSPLDLRQSPFAIAALAGHGAFPTTMSNYVEGMECVRREHADQFIEAAEITFSIEFLSGLTGIKESTYRKRLSRGAVIDELDLMEGFEPAANAHFANRIVDISDLVVHGTKSLPPNIDSHPSDTAHAAAAYVASVVAGESAEVAAYVSQINEGQQKIIDCGLQRINKLFRHSWSVKTRIDPVAIASDELFADLARHLCGWQVSVENALYVAGLVNSRVDKPWQLPDVDALQELGELFAILTAAGIEPDVSIQRSKNISADFEARQSIKAGGIPHVEVIAHRHFRGTNSILLGFLPAGSTSRARPRLAAKTTFLVTANLISACALRVGSLS